MSRTLTLQATAGRLPSALSPTAVFVPTADAASHGRGPAMAVGHVPLVPREAGLLGPAPASTSRGLSVTRALRDPAALAAAVAVATQTGTFTLL